MNDPNSKPPAMPPQVAGVLIALVVAAAIIGVGTSFKVAAWWLGLLVASFVLHSLCENWSWDFRENDRWYNIFEVASGLFKLLTIVLLVVGVLAILVILKQAIFGYGHSSYENEELPDNYHM